ncbi:hypothetical protein B0H19DRAFT_1199193 [Mycena capillaripes]|nr:hypothetical protein B0H19DRAFT_1199193 [Mycena capillaripes]
MNWRYYLWGCSSARYSHYSPRPRDFHRVHPFWGLLVSTWGTFHPTPLLPTRACSYPTGGISGNWSLPSERYFADSRTRSTSRRYTKELANILHALGGTGPMVSRTSLLELQWYNIVADRISFARLFIKPLNIRRIRSTAFYRRGRRRERTICVCEPRIFHATVSQTSTVSLPPDTSLRLQPTSCRRALLLRHLLFDCPRSICRTKPQLACHLVQFFMRGPPD